ncbi:MAG: SprT family zinc-dependent metalloprotease [Candidatus Nanopelagicales bacterium]|nr:SprT family zinc-dependent metalloprotease [Candidatus Nanopelagicales bacterium]
MSTASASLTVSGIDIDVVYKDIKHLHIGVYPPMGRVRIAAPLRFDDDAVRVVAVKRLAWIKKHRARLQATERQTPREMVTGESHYVWGIRHRLKVIERPGRAHVETDADRLILYVRPGADSAARMAVLQGWQREQLRDRISGLVEKWQPLVGRSVSRWNIRRMKTRWGSCNCETGSIWFNLELAKKHPDCLEFVVVHEMTHLLERSHGERFTKLMDGFMPDWRARRDQLNSAPLAGEGWGSL